MLKKPFFQLLSLFLLVFVVVFGTTRLVSRAATACMTTQQINADTRCLYILSGNIYNKGTRNNPHQGHNCGIDVTSFIPSFHFSDVAFYLDRNFVAPVCTTVTHTTIADLRSLLQQAINVFNYNTLAKNYGN